MIIDIQCKRRGDSIVIETGKIKYIDIVKRNLRGRRYSVTAIDSGVKIGSIDGMDGVYALYDEFLKPDID